MSKRRFSIIASRPTEIRRECPEADHLDLLKIYDACGPLLWVAATCFLASLVALVAIGGGW